MDGSRFDALTRTFAERASRRTVLKGLAAGIGGSVVGLLGGPARATVRCRPVGQVCKTSADCCPGVLGNGNVYCANAGKKGKICQACASGTVACNGGCVNANTDSNNCGSCGRVCPSGTTCSGGTCTCPTAGQLLCGSQCIDVTADNGNCGACGQRCGGGTHCTNGVCVCSNGTTLCGGQCVNTATDNGNCGACGHSCFGGTSCANGLCQCPAGQHLCDDGACYVCCPGLTKCGDICVDLQADADNCGTCGLECRDGDGCVDGTCACTEASCPRSEGCFCLSSGTHPCVTAQVSQCGDKCGDGFDECPQDWICRGDGCPDASSEQFYCQRLTACPAV